MTYLQFGLDIFVFFIIPLTAILIDGIVGLRSRKIERTLSNKHNHDFTVLVPIYGNAKYLENIKYLSTYGSRVVLCTTGDESDEFYADLENIARKHKFRIFKDEPSSIYKGKTRDHGKRMTSGTIRDTIVRNALLTVVKTPYVVPIDADTETIKPLSLLVGELVEGNLDIASIRLVLTNRNASLLTHLQYHEYEVAMKLRYLSPWMISGACHVAKTKVLRDIMSKHSLFFQGNDVEIGIIATARKYKVGHIPFEVSTAVPSTLKAWFRQRLAWGGGEFRLFITNFWFVLHQTYLWIYGGIFVILLFPLRWLTLIHPSLTLIPIFTLYFILILILHWRHRDRYLILMPFYSLFLSLIVTPLGVIWYFLMVFQHKNSGFIIPNRAKLR